MKHGLQVLSWDVSISDWRWRWFFFILVFLPKHKAVQSNPAICVQFLEYPQTVNITNNTWFFKMRAIHYGYNTLCPLSLELCQGTSKIFEYVDDFVTSLQNSFNCKGTVRLLGCLQSPLSSNGHLDGDLELLVLELLPNPFFKKSHWRSLFGSDASVLLAAGGVVFGSAGKHMGLMNCVVQDICLPLEGNASQFFSFFCILSPLP